MIGAILAAGLVSLTPYQKHQWFEGPDHPAIRPCHGQPAEGACQLPAAVSPAEAQALLGAKATAWRREGDQLLVVARRNTDQAYLCCSPRAKMQRVSADLWAVRARIAEFDRGLIEVSVVPEAAKDAGFIRGKDAPPRPEVSKPLQGQVHEAAIRSRYLEESRRLTIYTPPGFDASRRYPVVYMADGVFRADDFPIVERQILDGAIPPVVVVAIWPGIDAKDVELRSKEYLLGWPGGTARFARSERFLLDEVLTLAENRYGASTEAGDRLITGWSSGAAWAVSMAARNPAVFGQAAAFSLGWPGAEKGVGQPDQPRLFLSAGSFETTYYRTTIDLADKARRSGGEVVLRRLVSDHDNAAWQPMLVEALSWAFAARATG
jgi:enterochelin esterase-like enzyme